MVLRNVTQGSQTSDQTIDLAELISRLSSEFEAQPIEDGLSHPADSIVEHHLDLLVETTPTDLLVALAKCEPLLPSSVVKSLGRCAYPWKCRSGSFPDSVNEDGRSVAGTASSWRHELIDISLRTGNILLRDAAVQAVEDWEDASLLPLLQVHQESEPWLRGYISDVISDLSS